MTTTPDSDLDRPFEIVAALPPGWIVLPLDSSAVDIDELAAAAPPEVRARIEQLMVEAAMTLADAPVVFAAAYALFEEEVGLVLLIVMSVLVDEFPTDLLGVDDLLAAVEQGERVLVDSDTVELPLGQTLRGHRMPTDQQGQVGEFSTLYFTPLLGRDQLSVITFTSPQVELRDALTPLFDDIAQTVRYRWASPTRSVPSGV
jgi:hypothetical protein